jgi:hypothetical protein
MPQTPDFAISFNEGLQAASNGVFLPNSFTGRSAIPSPINNIAFIPTRSSHWKNIPDL